MNFGKTNNIEGMTFEKEEQKQTAIEIARILKESGLTQQQFADELGISLATLTNIFRPAYNKVPSIKVIRKIADFTDSPEETYNFLMKTSKQDLNKHPYVIDINDLDNPGNEIREIPMRDVSIIFHLSKIIQNITGKRMDFSGYTDVNIPRYGYVQFSGDYPISEWTFDFYTGFGYSKTDIMEFFYYILKSGAINTKFSFVTNSKSVYEELISLNDSIINKIHISVILFERGRYTETYITNNHSELDKAGLSL